MTSITVPGTNVLYNGSQENEPVTQTLLHADGSVFDGTGYTLSFVLIYAYATTASFTATGAGHVDWSGSPSLGDAVYTPSAGEYTGLTLGSYIGQWVATAGGRTKHFDAGSFELRRGY